jgi:hypothetical protein
MQTVTLQPIPAQSVKVVLDGQNCTVTLRQKLQGLFVDIDVDNTRVVSGVIARDAVPLACREYAGMLGNLLFIDTQGSDDPSAAGLGSRFQLVYLTAAEYALF